MRPGLDKTTYDSLERQLRRVRRRNHWRRYWWLYVFLSVLVSYNAYRVYEQGPERWVTEKSALIQQGWQYLEAAYTPDYATAGSGSYRVTRVVDGDTIHVQSNHDQLKIRLHGIDSPERGQPYSRAAGRALADMVAGKHVRLKRVDIDRYGRTVARVYIGNTYVNKAMLEQGYAWWYNQYAQGEISLWLAQRKARKAKAGLWAEPKPVPPWEWRRGHR